MNTVTAVLLAGGKSTRMGRDKCLVEIGGTPLWRRQLDLLAPLSDDVVVVAPTWPAWCPPTVRWIADAAADHGPLGGLVAALDAATHERVLVLAIDLPGMTRDYLRRLLAQSDPAVGVVPLIDDLFQPLSAVYPRAALAIANARLPESDKSLQRLVRELVSAGQMHGIPVEPCNLPYFRNLNSASD